MFQPVPDMSAEADITLGDVSVDATRAGAREKTVFFARSKRMYPHRSKDDERKLSLGFFLQRLDFLTSKEVNMQFRSLDALRTETVMKKNNVLVAPYILIATLAGRGFRMTETMVELYFPELHRETSKRFRFAAQIKVIQEFLGYPGDSYHTYDFETYFAFLALVLRGADTEVDAFDVRAESGLVRSLTEITYRLYVLQLRADAAQWSVSTGAVVSQAVNTVLTMVCELHERAEAEHAVPVCDLARENPLSPADLARYGARMRVLLAEMAQARSFKISRRDKDALSRFCRLCPAPAPATGAALP
ncbi:putative intermediate transcription factor VITF-3 [Parapoxvirus red deer/HL953]|uniref:Intermediate transcription factor 3 small subunit n=1 Tax=Parapoxvirus red deer/HL953 TaxID=1579460 RepID=A0A0A7M9S9_9POXV|nr:putative intermediate transcription factor VITF-3 [Parapoxvirus red deer/HL953]AIZ77335.1 putative intermediate transcription factor VITF-3 [Parapoxvirus red deer/HL953]